MKQLEDNRTLDLLEVPKRRGRPPTGKALSAAERQARHRMKRDLRAENIEFFARLVVEQYESLGQGRIAVAPRLAVAILDLAHRLSADKKQPGEKTA